MLMMDLHENVEIAWGRRDDVALGGLWSHLILDDGQVYRRRLQDCFADRLTNQTPARAEPQKTRTRTPPPPVGGDLVKLSPGPGLEESRRGAAAIRGEDAQVQTPP